MTDVKRNEDWHGRLELYGIGKPMVFAGSIQRIVVDMLAQIQTHNVQRGPNGKEILILIRDEPMEEVKEGADMISRAALNELIEGAEQSELTMEEILAQYDNPWTKESVWPRFMYLQARQVNYESSADEYITLWDFLESKYPEHFRTLKKRSH